ncbi:CDP-glycerol glycerophosphotransferase family protein [Candidatus Enterococcus mansonii]|nr:CDP-glycerol glycerophosphotransferase family protein [Enterococcus sp. 4G2_DIV0659]
MIKKYLVFVQKILKRVVTVGLFYIMYPVLFFAPINKKKIVVSNFNGKGYGDSAKYICDYLLDQDKEIDIVWLYEDKSVKYPATSFPKGIRPVKHKTVRALMEMNTAKIWIDNCRKSFYPRKRKKQFYLQTWHAGFTLKKIERDAEESLPPLYKERAIKDSKMCDLLVFESSDMIKDVHKTFWFEGETFRQGVPRNDIIVNTPESIIHKVYNHFAIDLEKKILLYAPTFRQGYELKIDNNFLLKLKMEMSKKFSADYELIVRLHPNDSENKQRIFNTKDGNQLIDGSDYDDMQELLCAVDTLITDYSSVMGEMMISNKKCFIYAYDYEEYKQDRGLLIELTELPFPIAFTEQELITKIVHFDETTYLLNIEKFKVEHNVIETGKASQELGDKLINVMVE